MRRGREADRAAGWVAGRACRAVGSRQTGEGALLLFAGAQVPHGAP